MSNYIEGYTLELKRQYTDDIKKTIIAFANESGGSLYIGIDDDGTIVGVDEPDKTSLQIINSVKNSIKPDLIMFLDVKTEIIEGRDVVVAKVERGSSGPYYIAEKGLKPTGVYIRSGAATLPATEEHIRRMIKNTDGDKYIEIRSFNQDLTFNAAEKEFENKDLKFGENQKITLGLLNKNSQYTNLGLLLSDQCQHTIKVAVFQGSTKTIFKSRKEFSGSLFSQLDSALDYIDYFNKIRSQIGKKKRVDMRDYPVSAIREGLINAIVHREYSFSGSTQVNVYDDRIEFLTLGGLVSGITVEAILHGASQSRNEKLANVFYRLEYIEAYGTGFVRIMNEYEGCFKKPEIIVTDSSFSLILPNMSDDVILSSSEVLTLEFIRDKGTITREELIKELHLGATRCYDILKFLENRGEILVRKNGRKLEYISKH